MENHIREYRLKLKMSQGHLSLKSGVSVNTISEVENGKHTPAVDVAMRLARALETTIEDLFCLPN